MRHPAILVVAVLLGAGLVLADAPETSPPTLAPPVKILAAGEPIDVVIGHAAPHVTDWNQDGKADLLVGQFGSGQLRIYLNTGTAEAPTFGTFELFQADGANGTVPSG